MSSRRITDFPEHTVYVHPPIARETQSEKIKYAAATKQ